MTIKPSNTLSGLRRLSRLLSLVLIPAGLVQLHAGLNRPNQVSQNTYEPETWHPSKGKASRPYLTVSGAPALRLKALPPPPNYEIEAPSPSALASTDDLATAPPAAPRERQDTPTTIRNTQRPESRARPPSQEIPAILPDDLRKDVRPEDVIPFFLFPQGGGGVGVSVPVPSQSTQQAPIPSSATYRQE